MRRAFFAVGLLLALGASTAFAGAQFWDLGPGISTGMTSDGRVVSFSSGTSANSAAIWSAQYGTKSLGSYTTSGVTWKGSTLIVAGNSGGQARRWDGNIQGVGTWSALPLADGGVYSWTTNPVTSIASDGTNVMIAGSSVYTNGYAHACRYKDNGSSSWCTNLELPANGHDHSYLRGVSENDVWAGAAQYAGTPPTGGARQTIAGSPLNFVGNLMGNPTYTNEAIGLAISGNGSRAAGWSYISTSPIIYQACYWDAPYTANRVAHAIPFVPGYYWASATFVSRTGAYIGGAMWETGDLSQTAFIWDAVHGTRLVKDLLTVAGIDLTGWQLSDDCDVEVDFDGMFDISGISEDGTWITGTGRYGGTGPFNGERRVWVAFIGDDTTPPQIESVAIAPTMVAAGDAVRVTVNATDNVDVTSVTADGLPLAKSGVDTWSGTIYAASALGSHPVQIVAKDAANNSAADTSGAYKTARILATSTKATAHPIMAAATSTYLFKVWGQVQVVDDNSFWLDDGSGTRVKVLATGHGLTTGANKSARGILDTSGSPYTLTNPVIDP